MNSGVKMSNAQTKASGAGSAGASPAKPSRRAPRGKPEARTSARGRNSAAMDFAEKWAALIGFAAMVAFFWIAKPSTFGTITNFKNILDQAAIPVLLGVGLTIVLAVGEFDLAFPYGLGLASAAITLVMRDDHFGTLFAVLVGVLVGCASSALAGVLVAQQRVSSFVVTLGFGFVWLGLADGLTNSQTIISGLNDNFIALTDHRVFGLTLATMVAAVFALVIGVVFRWTVLGRYIQSVGSNPTASRIAGLPISGVRISAYALLGLGVGIGGVIITSRQAQYTPNVGAGLFLAPYVAAFFGMSVLGKRRFNVLGTVIGALFMGTLQTGLIVIGAASWVGEFIQGTLLLIILLIARRG
jgi:ribose/xylose/arabinose/galactoside ABC-type transport system permease subunit